MRLVMVGAVLTAQRAAELRENGASVFLAAGVATFPNGLSILFRSGTTEEPLEELEGYFNPPSRPSTKAATVATAAIKPSRREPALLVR